MKKFLMNMWTLIFLLTFVNLVFSDEGMWMPHQMKNLDLKKLGLQMDPGDLYKKDGTGLMSAVVHLGGGTGEFVSRKGLILTNHHVAFGALQRASDPEHNYIEDGFNAETYQDEIPAPGYIADVLLGYEEVTKKIEAAIKPGMSHFEKYKAIEQAEKKLIAEAESAAPDLRCRVASMYSGNQYYLFRFKRLKDIRIVLAPPRDLGNFGGDIDNWMWPRHTCDFAFLRAYVSKDNIGVDYDENNVPYQPKSIIKISLDGVQEDDFTFVMGYPGRTYRNYTLAELEHAINQMKESIELRKEMIAFFEKASEKDKAVEIKYASLIKGLNNGLKNYQGKLEGFQKANIIEKKKETHQEFRNWVQANEKRQQKYGSALEDIREFMDKYAAFDAKREAISNFISRYYGSAMLSQAYLIVRAVEERTKPDMEREPYYQDRNFDRLQQGIKLAERRYDFETDKTFFKHQLKRLASQPKDKIPDAFKSVIEKNTFDEYVNQLYTETKLADPDYRIELLDSTPEELLKLKDPFIQLAAEIEHDYEDLREQQKALSQERKDLKKVYLKALLEKTDGNIAPDANGTIRFTYGEVAGYSPRDAVTYKPLTSLSGVVEKDTGEEPFDVPEKLKLLYAERDFGKYIDENLNDVPICFLNTTNVTGGNSGSPTLNARGEQVGIIFDMTYESVIGDYYIIPEFQRTISVDIRYVLFITDKFSGATHILKEIGL
ncbi:S46 family peptidase [candidate division KSB1 bacterium]|nr:S46 family peptidase [candidate division KSB1 bacterium]